MKSIYKKIIRIMPCFLFLFFSFCSHSKHPSSNLLNLFTGSILNPNATGIFTLGGTVRGLKGILILQNNKKDDLVISANGSFAFPTRLQDEAIYSVTVLNQPANQNCTVTDGAEQILDADIDSVFIFCQTIPIRYVLGGTLSQLKTGNQIILFNRFEELTLSANGNFNFKNGVFSGSSYTVTASSQPVNQNCIITNPTGRMPETNLNNLEIICFGNVYGALVNGTIINPLSMTSAGVISFAGSDCNPDTTCAPGSSGFIDSVNPGSVLFQNPEGIITDGFNLYIADKSNNRIRKITLTTGETTTLAGNGTASLQDGTGTSASIDSPQFLTTDGLNIYLADNTNKAIRRINLNSGIVNTLISGIPNLANTQGLLIFNNTLYITDNINKAIRRLNLATNVLGTIITSNIALTLPKTMALVGSDMYLIDGNRILKTNIGTWALSIFAGGNTGYTNGTGSSAEFNSPTGITTDGTNLYISDSGNHAIRKIVLSTSVVTTLAGPGISSSGYANSSTASNSLFNFPSGITSDGASLFVVDKNNHTIRKIQ